MESKSASSSSCKAVACVLFLFLVSSCPFPPCRCGEFRKGPAFKPKQNTRTCIQRGSITQRAVAVTVVESSWWPRDLCQCHACPPMTRSQSPQSSPPSPSGDRFKSLPVFKSWVRPLPKKESFASICGINRPRVRLHIGISIICTYRMPMPMPMLSLWIVYHGGDHYDALELPLGSADRAAPTLHSYCCPPW